MTISKVAAALQCLKIRNSKSLTQTSMEAVALAEIWGVGWAKAVVPVVAVAGVAVAADPHQPTAVAGPHRATAGAGPHRATAGVDMDMDTVAMGAHATTTLIGIMQVLMGTHRDQLLCTTIQWDTAQQAMAILVITPTRQAGTVGRPWYWPELVVSLLVLTLGPDTTRLGSVVGTSTTLMVMATTPMVTSATVQVGPAIATVATAGAMAATDAIQGIIHLKLQHVMT